MYIYIYIYIHTRFDMSFRCYLRKLRSGETFMNIDNFSRKTKVRGPDFLTYSADTYHFAPVASSGAESNSQGVFSHARSI